jgi:hypothetical protein
MATEPLQAEQQQQQEEEEEQRQENRQIHHLRLHRQPGS